MNQAILGEHIWCETCDQTQPTNIRNNEEPTCEVCGNAVDYQLHQLKVEQEASYYHADVEMYER